LPSSRFIAAERFRELRKVLGTSKFHDSSAAFDLKSPIDFSACGAGTSNRRH